MAKWHLSFVWYLNANGFVFLALTLSEFIVSSFADKSESKYGRRKPYVVIGNLISSIGVRNKNKFIMEILLIIKENYSVCFSTKQRSTLKRYLD